MLSMSCAHARHVRCLGLFGELGFEVQITRLESRGIGVSDISSQYFGALRSQSERSRVEPQSIVESDFQMHRLNAKLLNGFHSNSRTNSD